MPFVLLFQIDMKMKELQAKLLLNEKEKDVMEEENNKLKHEIHDLTRKIRGFSNITKLIDNPNWSETRDFRSVSFEIK